MVIVWTLMSIQSFGSTGHHGEYVLHLLQNVILYFGGGETKWKFKFVYEIYPLQDTFHLCVYS